MSAFYDEAADTIVELLGEFGVAAKLRTVTNPGALNPATGLMVGRVVQDRTARVVFQVRKTDMVDGTMVVSDTRTVVVSPDGLGGVAPKTSEKLVVTDPVERELEIVDVEQVMPADQVLCWKLQVRG